MQKLLFFLFIFFGLLHSSCALFDFPTKQQVELGPQVTRMGFEDDEGSKDTRGNEIVHADLLRDWTSNKGTGHDADRLFSLVENEHRMNLSSVALARLQHPNAQKALSSSTQLRLLLAEIYYSLDLFDIAEKNYLQILQTDTKSLNQTYLVHWRLFTCYEKMKSYEKALNQLQDLQKSEPDGSFVHYKRGNILARMGPENAPQAQAEFQQAIQKKPDFKAAHLELAQLLMNDGRFAESSSLLSRLERKYGFDIDVHKLAGESSLQSGDLEDAERRFLILTKSDSFGIDALKKLSQIYQAQNNLGRQIWALTEALRMDSADDQLRFELADTYLKGNQVLEAQKFASDISPQSDLYIEAQLRLIQYFEKNQDTLSVQTKKQQLALKFPENQRVQEIIGTSKIDKNRSPAGTTEATELKK